MRKIFLIHLCALLILCTDDVFSQLTFNYTGAAQFWTVLAGVSTVTITPKGAQGGGISPSQGGFGAAVTSIVSVIPGQTLQINVGGQGSAPGAGWNGGGAGQSATASSCATGPDNTSYGGGGASDIRMVPYTLSNRIIVAAGGGGMGGGDTDAQAGGGGCNNGLNGMSPFGQGGFGATQTAGGAGGPAWIASGGPGQNGSLGIGGVGGLDSCYNIGSGGGGGGGYYGGGGGGSDCFLNCPVGGGGGGGGSSLVPAGGTCIGGNNQGNGVVILQWNSPPCTTTYAQIDSVILTTTCISNNGAIYISDSTSAAPLTYLWSNGASTQDITGLSAGTYYVSITDSTGCIVTLGATISSPSSVFVTVDMIVTVACGGANTGEIYVSVSGGIAPYTYNWSNGATTQDVTGLPYGNYMLTVTDSAGCSVSLSASVQAPPNLPVPDICMVTVDSLSQNNVIIWDKTSFSGVDSFIVYREIMTNNYMPIGAVSYDSLSLFVDTVRTKYFPNTGDPNAGTYRYKIQLRDSCGNYSSLSPYHNTIFMTNNSGNFSWAQLYTIENSANPVGAYVLMRDDYSNGNWNAINSVAGTQQTVTDPAYAAWQSTANWRVQTLWSITCTPSRLNPQALASFNASKSNTLNPVVSSVNESIVNNSITIYPNPTKGKINLKIIQFDNLKMENVDIYNVYGEKIHHVVNFQIDLSSHPSGIYFLKVKTNDGIVVKKIIKE